MSELPAIIRLQAQTEELADCWLWQGATTSQGYPIVKHEGSCKLVRRVMFELHGGTLTARQPIATMCGEKLCVNPEHLKASTVAKVAQAAAKRGAWTGLTRSAKIATKKRKTAKINMGIAQEIRNSTEINKVLAARFGINKSLAARIKSGHAWRDYSNPFQGLMT